MSNAYSAAQFIVNLYASTGAVKYLDDKFFHSKQCVIEMLMLAYINRKIFYTDGTWPWSELKIAIMHRYDWKGAVSASCYEDLFTYAAGRVLERAIDDVDVSSVSKAITASVNRSTATFELAKVLHDLKIAQFAITGQDCTAEELYRRQVDEFYKLFPVEDAVSCVANFRNNMSSIARKSDLTDLFCFPEFAKRYGDALRTRAAEMAALNP